MLAIAEVEALNVDIKEKNSRGVLALSILIRDILRTLTGPPSTQQFILMREWARAPFRGSAKAHEIRSNAEKLADAQPTVECLLGSAYSVFMGKDVREYVVAGNRRKSSIIGIHRASYHQFTGIGFQVDNDRYLADLS